MFSCSPDPKDDPDKGEFFGEERFGLYKKMQQWCETESSLLEVVVSNGPGG